MSLRRDLPEMNFPRGLVRAAAYGDEGGAPQSVMAALQTLGEQVREHRSGIEAKIGDHKTELNARLQQVEQIVAKGQAMGGASFGMSSPKPVSAQVLEDAEGSLEALRNGTQKSVRMSVPSFFPQAASIVSGDLYIPGQRGPEVYGPLRRPWSVRDLLITRPTTGHPSSTCAAPAMALPPFRRPRATRRLNWNWTSPCTRRL